MVGAYAGWFLVSGLHLPLALNVTDGSGYIGHFGSEHWAVRGVRPFQKKTRSAPLLATLGISMILDQLAKSIFSPFTVHNH
ncbi:MAG TPA: hypothetical protein DDW65_07575 [Firmicutes bacterium]|jgi:branched-chain amino acid transport system permease protein|nr:hypothetical protein [Bacillota bacterium]